MLPVQLSCSRVFFNPAKDKAALFAMFYGDLENRKLADVVGPFAGRGGTGFFVIAGTVVGKHKIKRLSETLPCLFSHLVS